MNSLDKYGNCPVCNESWDGGDIHKDIRKHYSETFKWSKLIGIEIRERYDGISIWECPFCKSQWDRFTEELITNSQQIKKDDEVTLTTENIHLETRSKAEEEIKKMIRLRMWIISLLTINQIYINNIIYLKQTIYLYKINNLIYCSQNIFSSEAKKNGRNKDWL